MLRQRLRQRRVGVSHVQRRPEQDGGPGQAVSDTGVRVRLGNEKPRRLCLWPRSESALEVQGLSRQG